MSVKVTPARYEIVLNEAEYAHVRAAIQGYAAGIKGTYLYDYAKVAAEALDIDIEEVGY